MTDQPHWPPSDVLDKEMATQINSSSTQSEKRGRKRLVHTREDSAMGDKKLRYGNGTQDSVGISSQGRYAKKRQQQPKSITKKRQLVL